MADSLLLDLNVPSVISKDECIYCFASPYNDDHAEFISDNTGSIGICLSCFQSVCKRHIQLHMQVTNTSCDSIHLSYLETAKVRKLDIGLSGKETHNKKLKLQVIEKSEEDTYDTLWTLKQYNTASSVAIILSNNQEKNLAPESYEVINKILNAKSQDMVDQTKTWELEINSCKHTKHFTKIIEQKDFVLDHCSSCNLNQNLWLCLHCGNIGCGREQIGIDGYSHGLSHYQLEPRHPLVVKLGSLSESSSDIYCYKCDDEVKFEDREQFVKILSHYGINLNSRLASEKTLVELQIEQSLNWDFKMVDIKGHELIKLSPGKVYGCGLINLGNSCYLNSILQILFDGGVPQWSLEELGTEFPLDVVFPADNLNCQLIKLQNALKVEPERYPNGVKPTSFKKCIAQSHEEFSTGRQQDAMEFFTYFIEQLDTKLFRNNDDKNPNNLLKCTIEEKLQCSNCLGVKFTTQTHEAIQLPLNDNDDPQQLSDNLEHYFKGEEIEFKCEKCKTSDTASKRPGFKSFPSTLVINPVRIKLQNWVPVKTSNELNMPGLGNDDLLNIKGYISKGFNPDTDILLKDSEDSNSFIPNPIFFSQLSDMGFTENAIKRALFTTGNQDTESAMNWLFQHIEDVDINDEFVPPKSSKTNDIDAASLENMISMGLDPKLCKKALVLNKGDVNKSVEWVFSNIDDDGEMPTDQTEKIEKNEYGFENAIPYRLIAVVCHKGNSVQSGHYVAFIKKEYEGEQRWILYNDEKMVIADELEELKKNGYIYLYSRTE